MKLTECLPDAHCQKLSSAPRPTLRVAKGRLRCCRQISLVAVLMMVVVLTICSPAHATTIHVNTTQQGVTIGQCSLQEAIYSSEFKTNSAIGATDPDTFYTTGCEPGTGVDTIELPSNAVFNFTQFWDGDAHNIFGPTATPVIFSTITIEGNGAMLQWTGVGNSRLFYGRHRQRSGLSVRHRESDAQERLHQGISCQRGRRRPHGWWRRLGRGRCHLRGDHTHGREQHLRQQRCGSAETATSPAAVTLTATAAE